MKSTTATKVKTREMVSGSWTRSIKLTRNAPKMMLTRRMATVIESLS